MSDESNGAAIDIRELVVQRGDVVAVDGLSLEIVAAGITSIVGPSGCGKTTLLRAIAGFEEPLAGSIEIGGECVATSERWVAPERRRVGMVFQEGALFPHLDVEANVRYGVRKLPGAEARVAQCLELVGLADLRRRMPDELSGGQQQRVALARALAPEPRVVLLDEPFASLDAALKERVRDEVRRILLRAGVTVVLVTHDQEEALSMGARVAVMDRGRILQVGTPEEVYRRPETPRVADFIGEGCLVPCTVEEGRFVSAFGAGRCEAGTGVGRLLLRPEDLLLQPPGSSEGIPARIVARRFYGHDVLDRIRLESGEEADIRSLSPPLEAVESRVRVTLRDGLFWVFS